MTRVADQLASLRSSLQERIEDDFDAILAHRRSRRRNAIVAGGFAVLICVLAGSGLVVTQDRGTPAAQQAGVDPTAGPGTLGQTAVHSRYPPCGWRQKFVTRQTAQSKLGSRFVLPSNPNANESSVEKIAFCAGGSTAIVFNSGVVVYTMPPPAVTPDWKQSVAADPNESKLGSINGIPAWVIMPDPQAGADGSVTFIRGDNQIIVEGNSELSADQLVAIASSLHAAK